MIDRRLSLALVGALALAACHPADGEHNGAAPRQNAAEATTATSSATVPAMKAPTRDLEGRWTGVEGMYLVVTPGGGDTYRLDMQYDLDHKGSYTGRRVAEGIAFEREGRRLVLKPGNGDATGLKWLAGKHDCLTVAPGEGYCRD